ncbi:MAG: hypothetical protein NTX45_29375 [Proteobacteria bacterium]|nr:hypothetical protein [Pseudomonadota bacterium]
MRFLPPRINFYRACGLFWSGLGISSLLALIWRVVHVFQTPENMNAPIFGTAGAPYSDPILWLEGGLFFLFGMQPKDYLYRPTIGLFWSSILAITSRVEMIPIFFVCWAFVFLAGALLLARDPSLRKALIIWLALSAISFPQTWLWLNIATASVDFAAFTLTLSGVILLIYNPTRRSVPVEVLIAASLCLGIAAAIRGPMMLGGSVMILARVALMSNNRSRTGLITGVVFIVPIALDMVLQRYFGIINNGMVGLFCVYSDPSHTWTPTCHTMYLAKHPVSDEVQLGYVRFLFSASGLKYLFETAVGRISLDLGALQHTAVYILILLAGFLGSVPLNQSQSSCLADVSGAQKRFGLTNYWISTNWLSLLKATGIVGTLLAMTWLSAKYPWANMALVFLALGVSMVGRLWRPSICYCGYMAGTTFLCLIGLVYDRLQCTFSFMLYLGTALLITDTYNKHNSNAEAPKKSGVPLAWAILGAVVFLYVGNFVFPSKLRQTYLSEVYGQPMSAIKLSDDVRIDRSLYFTGDRVLIYTRHDQLPIGTTRRYRKLALESIAWNASFLQPNAFLE